MRREVKEAIEQGMPCLAECGGFMYLHKKMEDMEQIMHEMVGVIDGEVHRTPRLTRFGYISVTANEDCMCGPKGTAFQAHEFHYFESSACGDGFHAAKPASKRGWDCIQNKENLMAGFPHLYYYSNPEAIAVFLKKCSDHNGISEKEVSEK